MQDLRFFFEPVHFAEQQGERKYHPLQWGSKLITSAEEAFDIDAADIFILGCCEGRGSNLVADYSQSANAVRTQLYDMYYWHTDVRVADLGNIANGEKQGDSKAALTAVLNEIYKGGKIAIVIGGSHDMAMAQYEVYRKNEKTAIASFADMLIDLEDVEESHSGSFLMDMLTDTPNFIAHYNHIAFQSYFTQPKMLETLDKLRFDFYRLGKVKENIEDMEPVLRTTNFFSIDTSVVRYSDSPANIYGSPNGLTGEEICGLTRYAGMSDKLNSMSIFGFDSTQDQHNMTAKLLAQMLWYFVDGYLVRKSEAKLSEKDQFLLFNVAFTDHDTVFLKSKRTNRWWMRMPNNTFIPCSYQDYISASSNEIPERWLREQERLM